MLRLKIYFFLIFALFIFASCSHPQVPSPSKLGESTPQESTEPTIDPAWTGQTLINNVPPDSKTVGKVELVLGPIDRNSVYEKIGLKEGDVIKEWNGNKVTGRQDWTTIRKSAEISKVITVVIERNGKEEVLHYKK